MRSASLESSMICRLKFHETPTGFPIHQSRLTYYRINPRTPKGRLTGNIWLLIFQLGKVGGAHIAVVGINFIHKVTQEA